MDRSSIVDAILNAAYREWESDIRDSPSSPQSLLRVDRYIRDERGLGWSWVDRYEPEAFAWGGAFAMWCLRSAGFHRELARFYGSSSYRLDGYGRYVPGHFRRERVRVTDNAAAAHPELAPYIGSHAVRDLHNALGSPRLYQRLTRDSRMNTLPWLPHRGDLVLVGTDDYGHQVALCAGVDGDHVLTFEGNTRGQGPSSNWREGVVRHRRRVGGNDAHVVRRIIRPSLLDFVPELEFF